MSQPHIRTQVRQAAKAALDTLPVFGNGARVFASRLPALEDGDLPAAVVWVGDEVVEPVGRGGGKPSLQKRIMSITVGGIAAAADALEDDLDALALEIEAAMMADGSGLGGVVRELDLVNVRSAVDLSSDTQTGSIGLEFRCHVTVREGDPSGVTK